MNAVATLAYIVFAAWALISNYRKHRHIGALLLLFFTLLIPPAFERLLILPIVTRVILTYDKDFRELREENDWTKYSGYTSGILVEECPYVRTHIFYLYRACVYAVHNDAISGKDRFRITVEPPAPFLSIVPQRFPDRIITGGILLMYFDEDGRIVRGQSQGQ